MSGKTARPVPRIGNVLITSASRKIPLIRAMQDAARRLSPAIRVIAGDLDAHAHARYAADAFWAMPRCSDANLEALIAGCRERGITAILPTRDGELEFWGRHRQDLASLGIQVLVSDPDSVISCLDKLLFSQIGKKMGLPVIESADTPDAVGPGPYVVKERYGAGAHGIGLKLDRMAALAHARTLDAPIFQPFFAGPEISIDAWLDRDGRAVGVVPRWREEVVNGESQVTTTFHDEEVEAEARRCLEALALRGPVVMQAIMIDGRMQIIEVNPRFGGASTAGIAAGLDSLYWSLCEAFEEDFTPIFRRCRSQVRQIRIPADIVVHDPDL